MALTLERIIGSDQTLDSEAPTAILKFRVKGTLPYAEGGDAFDFVSSAVMSAIQTTYPTTPSPMGTLFWNSIQLHESHYAQLYEISVNYSPFERVTGTFIIRIEHAAGTAKATAGRRIAGYPADDAVDYKGVIFDGQEVVGVDVPFAQSRIVISYRHPEAFLDHAYLRAVGGLVGFPNNDTFLGYEPGEIRYAGGNATESEAEASAEYSFEVSRNEAGLVVGGITIDEKTGFDIISPVFKWDVASDALAKKSAIRPIKSIEIIRLREWTNYVEVFGWGGA